MKISQTTAELLDGTILGPVRVIYPDKIVWERTARANGWGIQSNPFRLESVLTWAALKRLNLTDLGYDEFLEQLADIEFETDEQQEDPTTADGIGSL